MIGQGYRGCKSVPGSDFVLFNAKESGKKEQGD
jgi:hypothetical protein